MRYRPSGTASPRGFFWLTQRPIAEILTRYGGHVVNVSATLHIDGRHVACH